ncbi:MAG: succinate dehydrogenase, hydrophobic membrane anchor protein [Gammaproteobacteria bacterium]
MNRRAYGLRSWILQRMSALYMALYLGYFICTLVFNTPGTYLAWKNWFDGAGVGVATVLFFFALLMHAWIGIRDVVMDYVHPVAMRFSMLSIVSFALIAMAAWVLKVLFVVGA